MLENGLKLKLYFDYPPGELLIPLKHPRHAVVEQTEGEEEVVEAGKHDQEVVEGVLHVLRGENVDGEAVTEDAKNPNNHLCRKTKCQQPPEEEN